MEQNKNVDEENNTLLERWRGIAYNSQVSQKESDFFWANYFNYEKGIYKQILANPDAAVAGTVNELAEKFDVELMIMTGFIDGINESLKTPNPIEDMTEETTVNLDYDMELLYKNMVEAKADWLYELEEWNDLISEERRKELYKEQKRSHTIVKDKKIGRNEKCPCGSDRKYKHCCGK